MNKLIYNKLKNDMNDVCGNALNNVRSNVFWNNYLNNAERSVYYARFGGEGWNDITFNPPRKVDSTNKSLYRGFDSSFITDLRNKNIKIDLYISDYLFQDSLVKFLPIIDLSNCISANCIFYGADSLVYVEKLIVNENLTFDAWSFQCSNLRKIIIEGYIGNNISLRRLPKLLKESYISFINALSPNVTDKTITLSKAYINAAFATRYGVSDGVDSSEWNDLVNAHTNWTFSLI